MSVTALRALLATCALSLVVAGMGCASGSDNGGPGPNGNDKANSGQAERQQSDDTTKDEPKPAESCAIAWNTTATEEHGTFGAYAESQATMADQARQVPGLAAEVPPRQQFFVSEWQFRDEEVAVIGPQESVAVERGACVVTSQETSATPGMAYVQTDLGWFDAYPAAQVPNVYGEASPRVAVYLDAATQAPSGYVLPDGRVDLWPGFHDGLGREPASPDVAAEDTEDDPAPDYDSGNSPLRYTSYSPASGGYGVEIPSGSSWSTPLETEPTANRLFRTTVRGPGDVMLIIDHTPREKAAFGHGYDSRRTVNHPTFGSMTEYVFSGGGIPECQTTTCFDYIVNAGPTGPGYGILGGGTSDTGLAQRLARHVAASLRRDQ